MPSGTVVTIGTAQRTCASTRGAATTAASAKEQGRVSTTTAAGVVASATAATLVNTASSKQIALSVKSARQAAGLFVLVPPCSFRMALAVCCVLFVCDV